MKAFIRSVGSYVPKQVITNHDLAQQIDTSDEWIYSHTGIRKRHIASPTEAASDLAAKAAESAFKDSGITPNDIDLILVATSTPDYQSFPSTACIVQDKIGAEHAGAMDLTAACTGFVYAIETAKAFIESGSAQHVLVIGSEIFSSILDWKDRNTCVLFGDGAGAAIVSAAAEDSDSRILSSYLRSQGSGSTALYRPVGGSKSPLSLSAPPAPDMFVKMDGRKVYMFAVRVLVEVIEKLLSSHQLELKDIDYIVPHQANLRIIDAAAKRIGLPLDKFYLNMDEYANTSAASIPIALHEMQKKQLLSRGMTVLFIGFGAGLAYGGNIIKW
ncbi:MAG: beta-ketoacyl-ACP synthase III [Spirochaetia bacterium]